VTGAGTAAAALLAVAFGWAALAKLADGRATAAAFAGLGLGAPGILARLVPGVELAAASVLLVRPAVGGLVALALLAAFSGLLALRLRQGAPVRCGCFGDPDSGPVTVATLARNALLAALAVTALAAPVPVRPDLPVLVAVTAAAASGAVTVALVGLRLAAGAVWDNRVPPGPEGLR
jgi:hypothetical protein